MQKSVCFIFTLLMFWTNASTMSAQKVTLDAAKEKAAQFFSNSGKSNATRKAPQKAPQLVLANNRDEFYVFNNETNGGYVVVSGDERMRDVLGYSYTGHFESNNIPCCLNALLEGYAEEVNSLKTGGKAYVQSSNGANPERSPISPMLECTWGHWTPYNNLCPEIEGKKAPSGCVAIAMAQIMHYHQWPKQTTDIIPGYTTKTLGIVVPETPITTIDWDNMLNWYNPYDENKYEKYYTKEQADAVATLMKLCNVAVKMDFGQSASGASMIDVADAFLNYFDYDNSTIDLLSGFGNDVWNQWNQIIYDELSNGRPVMCSDNEHAWVIDGYDRNDYFHMNYGEHDKVSAVDGYFSLSGVNCIIIGVQPNDPNTPHAYVALNEGTLTFYYDKEKENHRGKIFNNMAYASGNDEIEECVFDPSFANFKLRNLGSFMRNNKNLKTIKGINYLNTSEARTMDAMFKDCSSLTGLDVSGFNTSSVTDMHSMFEGCSSLTGLDVSGFNTSNVTDMGSMFYGCSSLTGLDVSGFDTSNVTDMGSMFYGCSSLTGLDVSSFDTSNVTDMGWMFDGCSSLTGLDVSGFDTSNVTNMYCMFDGCSSLTGLDVSGFDTSNVTDMGSMFYGCSSLTGLDVSGFDTSNVTNMGVMFDGCSSLTGLDVSGFDTSNVTNMHCMFDGCSSLTGLDVSGFDTSNVTDMSVMFASCSSLTGLDLSNFDTSNVTDMDCMFSGCSSLTGLDVSGFDTSNVTNMGVMFDGCSSLTGLDVSGFDTSNVTNMHCMFDGCSSLTGLDVSGFDTSNVTNMGWMFDGCSSLTGLDVSGFDTSNVTNMYCMFRDCSSLTGLDLSSFDTSNVTDMGWMFDGCSSLTGLDVSGFNTSNVTDMIGMFQDCSSLTELDLSNFDTSNVTRTSCMFLYCTNMSTIYASESWSMSNVVRSDDMFVWCSNLIGGAGTAYDDCLSNNADYARIDGGLENPGYFTYKENTAIQSVRANEDSGDIYSLSGVRLRSDSKGTNGLKSGIYIVKGKKLIVK